jgi:hypothetical protein
VIRLTGEQIAFIRTSLDYSALALSNYDYGPVDRAWGAEHRRWQEDLIESIRQALSGAVAD